MFSTTNLGEDEENQTVKSKTKRIAVMTLICLLVSVIVFPGISGCRSEKSDDRKSEKANQVEINLLDFYLVGFEGKDSEGTVWSSKLMGDLLLTELKAHPDQGEFFEDNEKDLQELIDSIKIKLTKTSALSDGEMIPLAVEYDEDLAEELGIVFLYPDVRAHGFSES